MVKIDNIGTRIHQLKASVKQLAGQTPGGQNSKGLAGQTPKNSSGNLHLTIQVQDKSNLQGKPEQKQGLASPNFLQLEKKIAQWRESNLCKSSEREWLVSARDKGKQLSNSGNFTKT